MCLISGLDVVKNDGDLKAQLALSKTQYVLSERKSDNWPPHIKVVPPHEDYGFTEIFNKLGILRLAVAEFSNSLTVCLIWDASLHVMTHRYRYRYRYWY